MLDTAFFTGNYAPKYSIQAMSLTPEGKYIFPNSKYLRTDTSSVIQSKCRIVEYTYCQRIFLHFISCISEEALIPERHSEMGSACSECDLEQIQHIDFDRWDEIVPVTPLRAGYEETRLNFQKVNCS